MAEWSSLLPIARDHGHETLCMDAAACLSMMQSVVDGM